jgi:hypothetical protein
MPDCSRVFWDFDHVVLHLGFWHVWQSVDLPAAKHKGKSTENWAATNASIAIPKVLTDLGPSCEDRATKLRECMQSEGPCSIKV